MTGAAVFVALALVVILITHPRTRRILRASVDREPRLDIADSPGPDPDAVALTETRAAA